MEDAEIGTATSNPLTITTWTAKSGKEEKMLYWGEKTDWSKGPARY